MDMTSRVGKEARVAMEIAMDDFNTKTNKNLTLHARNSHGSTVQAIHDATDLINTHKVDAILGLQTLEEVVSVGEIVSKAQIPTLSFLHLVPQWALDHFPFLVQASTSQFVQMKAFVAILESFGWNSFTFIYEDMNSASTQVIPYLMELIKESSIQMSSTVRLPSLSSSTLRQELLSINANQCRVFLVHASLEMGINLFKNAKRMGMMEKEYVWITTNLITDLLHTVNSSTFSIMEGVVGIGSFLPENDPRFHDFRTKFQKRFKIEQPEEENNNPGIFAVQAYDATWFMASILTKNMSGKKILDEVTSSFVTGNTSEVQFISRQSVTSHISQIINVIGIYYRQVGFWTEGRGFSEVINDMATYDTSMQNLGHIFWPGKPLHTPRGWAIPTDTKPLRVGVPTMAVFKKPFTFDMWVVTIMFNIYNAFVIYLIEKKHSHELQGSVVNQIGILLSLAFTRMFSRSCDEVHSNLSRITTIAWLFAAIIIGQCYTASLTSMLTIKRLTPKVTDYETLKNANVVVGYGKGSHVSRYLEDVLGFKNESLRSFTSPDEYAHALRSRQVAALFIEAPLAKLFLAKYCKSFIAAGTTFNDGGFGFVLPKGSPLVSDFTKALLNVSESGTLRDIEKKMLGSEQCVDQDTIPDEFGSLGLSSFWSLFILTGGTSTIALATYVIISLRKYYLQMEHTTIISDIRKYIMYRKKKLSRKISDIEIQTI
ncbi:hypothetical protein E3N88_41428 [Mikania micrantha]|uniref:Ionotropic glutamate receptor C-terminal domain-containing protein n=1 Tax=Mikania micrantha TaxID=192012 RepID=A0A5N6LRC3_9ASTR|nr:hypothetical protein E3N88_41428 [Mikania micrantha]